jgi:hypothetical protein
MIRPEMERVIELVVVLTCFAAGLTFLEVYKRGRTPGRRRVYAGVAVGLLTVALLIIVRVICWPGAMR